MARTKDLFFLGVNVDSIKTLERTCRSAENNFETFKLIALKAGTSEGKRATKATFEEVEDGSEIKKLSIEEFSKDKEKDAEFKGDAIIITKRKDVLVFRK
jgi:hypothetical protein